MCVRFLHENKCVDLSCMLLEKDFILMYTRFFNIYMDAHATLVYTVCTVSGTEELSSQADTEFHHRFIPADTTLLATRQ